MRRQWIALCMAASLLGALGVAAGSLNPESSGSPRWPVLRAFLETGLVVGPGDHLDPDIDWPYLAWEERGPSSSRVSVLDLASGRFMIPGALGPWQRFPQLNGPWLGYPSGLREVGGCEGGYCSNVFNLSSGERFQYPGPSLTRVVVAGPYFAQVKSLASPGVARKLDLRYIANGTSAWVRYFAEYPTDSTGPVAQGDTVVLSIRPYGGICDGFEKHACVNDLAAVFVNNFTVVRLTNSVGRYDKDRPLDWGPCDDFTVEGFPSVSGSMVYWQDNRNSSFAQFDPINCTWSGDRWDIYGFDLQTRKEMPVRTNPWNETHPDADGNLLVWADDRNGNWDIYGMRVDTGEEFRVTDDPATQRDPVISNGCIAWEDNRKGKWDIFGTCLSEQSPPEANAGGPYTGTEGSPVRFDAGVSRDPDGDSLQYRWDFDSDGAWDTLWASTPTAVHAWGDDWTGNARVEVSDGRLTAIAQATVVVTNVAPAVSIDDNRQTQGRHLSPGHSYPLDPITFDGFGTDVGSDDLTFTWSWGDGTADAVPTYFNDGVGPDPFPSPGGAFPFSVASSRDHTYDAPGDYTVNLTVADDDGDSATTHVEVHVSSPSDLKHEAIQRIKALKGPAFERGDRDFLKALDLSEEEVWESLGVDDPFEPSSIAAAPGADVTVAKNKEDKVTLRLGPWWNSRLPSFSALRVIWSNGEITNVDLPKGWPNKDLDFDGYPRVGAWPQHIEIRSERHGKGGPVDLIVRARQASLDLAASLDDAPVAALAFTYDLDPFWVDATHLDPKEGEEVFDEEGDAVERLIEEEHGPAVACTLSAKAWTDAERTSLNGECDMVANLLLKADEVLARVAIGDAKEILAKNPKNAQKVAKEIGKAEKEMADAYEAWDVHDYDEGIDEFEDAWEHAMKAIELAMKS